MATPAADEIDPKTSVGIGANYVSRHDAYHTADDACDRKCDLVLLWPAQGIHSRDDQCVRLRLQLA